MRRHGSRRRISGTWFCGRMRWIRLLLLSLGAIGTVVAHESEINSSSTIRKHHHRCIHDEKIGQFEDSIDLDSITSPQLLMPFESPMEQERNTFLEAVGARRLRSNERSLSAAASSTPFQPIRIAFDLSKLSSDPGLMCVNEGDVVKVDGQSYTCSSNDLLTAVKKDFIISVLLKAIQDYFGNTLSVQRVVGNLIVGGIGCSSSADWACCSRSIPPSYKTEGVPNADYVLHVTARPTTGSTIAWALPCNIDQYGRPISGQANFGPGRLDPVTPAARSEQIGTALHEMTHALVFSKSRFYDFRKPLNGDLWGYKNVVSQKQGTGGIYISKIVTPNVVKRVKQQFNCLDWPDAGLELENGDSGSSEFSSHWEKRVVMNEYMSATSSYDPVYSALTLALFEDSGWYQVSYANAQILPWGYLEGCGVARSRCSEWNQRYICSKTTDKACTADYNVKGYCNVATYSSSIPAGFQYFNDPKFGGRDTYADYCPFYRGYSNGDCRGIGRVTTYADTGNMMEEVGRSSKCFQSSLTRSSSVSLTSVCYKVLGCTSDNLRLSIGGKEVLCPMQGGEIQVSGYNGRLVCPTANRLCQMLQDKCSGNGVLLATGSCECNPGFVGEDCAGVACPTSNGVECGGSTRGTCDYKTGKCQCTSAYTGLVCSELVCPIYQDGKAHTECSGHGTCDRTSGSCTCADGYSGKACECVPGCTNTSCGGYGTCDCLTGACACQTGHSGLDCSVNAAPAVIDIIEGGPVITDTIVTKGYKYYRIYLNSSSYDITFIVQYATTVDMDLYGSFVDQYPTSLSAQSELFTSNYGIGTRDEINLCGTLGVFPRGLNDTFRYCARATSSYVLETPGYFYIAVFGYTGGAYKLSIETDKCKGVDCSGHGQCGVKTPGVCTCDRYWSGEDCSVPKCGPDCIDLGTCGTTTAVVAMSTADVEGEVTRSSSSSGGGLNSVQTNFLDVDEARSGTTVASFVNSLRNTSECYGNGVCRVINNAAGKSVPQCVCDEAFSFTNPTPTQALCKELVPSVAYIQHYTGPFVASTIDTPAFQVKVNAWALYTIPIQDSWEVFVANLEILTNETDAMLFVRKEKLPAVATSTQSAVGGSFVQFMDADSWTAGSSSRKVVLTRATSTLSSGLYYIGVYNSAYARGSLGYRLTVNATSNCTAPSTAKTGADNSYGICHNGGVCKAKSTSICECPSGYVGKYCETRADRTVLGVTSSVTADTTGSSYIAYQSNTTELLAIGAWKHFSFDIDDTSVRYVQFRLIIENDLTVTTPTLPLLLVRGPSDHDFPTLFTESQQDFVGISKRQSRQQVSLAVDKACSYASTGKDCYKVALYNRQYSGETLRYLLEVEMFQSTSFVFPSGSCGSTGDSQNCYGNGKCLLVASSNSTNGETSAVPTCTCYNGWTGLRCNSPKSFELSQLWSAMDNISLLCSTCSSNFSLARGQVKMFRIPESLRDNVGLRLRVKPAPGSSTNGSSPNVYVSETLPRSIYDFTHISAANTSEKAKTQTLELANVSFSGHFWVVIFSDYPTSNEVLSSSVVGSRRRDRRQLLSRLQTLSSPHALRVLSEASGSETIASFQLLVELYELPDDGTSGRLLTQESFTKQVFHWLFHSPIGIGVFVFSVIFLLLIVSYCLWRLCHAPENQDRVTRKFFGGSNANPSTEARAGPVVQQRGHRSISYNAKGPALSRPGTAHVSDVELGPISGTRRGTAT